MKPRLRYLLLYYLLPILVCALIGGAVGWGYPYAKGGRRLFSSRHTGMHQPRLPTWEEVCHGRIRNGFILGGIAGLIIVIFARKPEA